MWVTLLNKFLLVQAANIAHYHLVLWLCVCIVLIAMLFSNLTDFKCSILVVTQAGVHSLICTHLPSGVMHTKFFLTNLNSHKSSYSCIKLFFVWDWGRRVGLWFAMCVVLKTKNGLQFTIWIAIILCLHCPYLLCIFVEQLTALLEYLDLLQGQLPKK